MKTSIEIITENIQSIIVVVRVDAKEVIGSRPASYKGFPYKKRFRIKVPLYMESDKFMLDRNDSLNAILARGLDTITQGFKEVAAKNNVRPPDRIEITIVKIFSIAPPPREEPAEIKMEAK